MYEVVLKDVEAPHHLGEDEYFVPASLEARKQLIQQDQFPCRAHQSLEMKVWSQRIVHLTQLRHYLLLSTCTEGRQKAESEQAIINKLTKSVWSTNMQEFLFMCYMTKVVT